MSSPATQVADRPVMLLVDDEPGVLSAVERDIRDRYGGEYRVVTAAGGQEGIDAAQELKRRGAEIALFLVDQKMPRVTGLDLLEGTRDLYPDAKRVLLTGYSDTQVAIQGINEIGLDHYLVKPWQPPEDKLYPVVDDLVEEWSAGRTTAPIDRPRVVGHRWSPAVGEIKDFLVRNRIPYRFLDAEAEPEAAELLASVDRELALPVVFFPEGTVLERPDSRALAQAASLPVSTEKPYHDLVVIGAGPAGLAAAVYGASEGLSVLVLERWATGGQAGTSSKIENYLGFHRGVTGEELARRALIQAERFGAEVITAAEVASIGIEDPMRVTTLVDGTELRSRAILLASGMTVRTLNAPGFDRLRGRGIYYGAAPGEAEALGKEHLFVIGGANSAGQAAMMLARSAASVHLVVRGTSMADHMSQYLVDQVEARPNIEVLTEARVMEAVGDDHVTAISVKQRDSDPVEYPAAGIFVFIGAVPHTSFLGDLVMLSPGGFVLTGPDVRVNGEIPPDWPLKRHPFFLETNLPGVFAAGDVRNGSIRRVAAAVGSGAASLSFIHEYLASV